MDEPAVDPARLDSAVSGLPLEPGFLFSEQLLQTAIPELLAQTGTTGRQFAHLLIRVHSFHTARVEDDVRQSRIGIRKQGNERASNGDHSEPEDDEEGSMERWYRVLVGDIVRLENGDRITLTFTRTKDAAQGTMRGKTDRVDLKGKVKGDDGSTMGPGRVGVFTNSGIIVVHSVRITGRVDMEWFRKELEFMVAGDPGPPEND